VDPQAVVEAAARGAKARVADLAGIDLAAIVEGRTVEMTGAETEAEIGAVTEGSRARRKSILKS
jgi:hypothetical protein